MKEKLLQHLHKSGKYWEFYATNIKTLLESLNIAYDNFLLPYSTIKSL